MDILVSRSMMLHYKRRAAMIKADQRMVLCTRSILRSSSDRATAKRVPSSIMHIAAHRLIT